MSRAAGLYRQRRRDSLAEGGWQRLIKGAAGQLPHRVREWMQLSSSMTRQLQQRVGSDVRVRVLSSGLGRLLDGEARLLQVAGRSGFVREVCLYRGEEGLLVARTVFSSKRLMSDFALSSLGTRPLGELLFENGNAARWTAREFALLKPGSALFPLIGRCRLRNRLRPCWARRTVFEYCGEPLLVTEIFLPSMLGLTAARAGAEPARNLLQTARRAA